MFVLYFIILLILFSIILIIFTTIKINIQNLQYFSEETNGRHVNKNYKLEINLSLFGKIRYYKIDLTKTKTEKLKIRNSIDKLEQKIVNNKNKFDTKVFRIFKYLKINNLNLKIKLGTEDASVTAILIGVISTFIAIVLKNYMKRKYNNHWEIIPVYQNRNLLKINLNCIFSIKLIDIIYTMYILNKKGEVYGTSDRRAYAYSNE